VEPRIIDDPADFSAAVASGVAHPLALATEATSLDPMRAELVGMSLASAPGGRGTSVRTRGADGELAGGTAPRNLPPLSKRAAGALPIS